MGFLEAIVVVYLRQLYFPEGFDFPLNPIPPKILAIEWLREITTLVMLVSIGIIAGKNFLQRFSYFLYCFAVWDIFYYVALKLLLNWPPSLLTWDLLFLFPVVVGRSCPCSGHLFPDNDPFYSDHRWFGGPGLSRQDKTNRVGADVSGYPDHFLFIYLGLFPDDHSGRIPTRFLGFGGESGIFTNIFTVSAGPL
jgi:hypothetical protein